MADPTDPPARVQPQPEGRTRVRITISAINVEVEGDGEAVAQAISLGTDVLRAAIRTWDESPQPIDAPARAKPQSADPERPRPRRARR